MVGAREVSFLTERVSSGPVDLQWQGLLEAIPDAAFLLDPSSRIRLINSQAEQMFGYGLTALVGENMKFLAAGEFHRLERAIAAALQFNGEGSLAARHAELVCRRGGGGQVVADVSLKVTALFGERLILACVRDVTPQRVAADLMEANIAKDRALVLLEEQATRLSALLNAIVAGVVMFDPNGCCVTVNHQLSGFLNREISQLLGRTKAELQQEISTLFRDIKLLSPGSPSGMRTVTTWESKPRFFAMVWGPVLTASGSVLGQIFTFRDITRETEVDRIKQGFIATVSHELRTPMTSIKASIGLMLGGAAGGLATEQREMLSVAERNVNRLIRLINDILDLSRVEAGRLELRRLSCDVNEVVNSAVQELENVQLARRLHLSANLAPSLPPVNGDADRIEQVLVNLLGNAYQFTEPGGVVTVQTTQVGDQVQVKVSDSGPGIDEDQLGSIFEPFQRGSGSADKAGGSGLGLSIARAIVREHGGQIWAESRPGVGSAFTFTVQATKTE